MPADLTSCLSHWLHNARLHACRRPNIEIVNVQWLLACMVTWQIAPIGAARTHCQDMVTAILF